MEEGPESDEQLESNELSAVEIMEQAFKETKDEDYFNRHEISTHALSFHNQNLF